MVMNFGGNFCAVYVDADVTREALITSLLVALGGQRDRNTLFVYPCEVYVDDNDEFDADRRREFPDGFLFYRFQLEVFADRRPAGEENMIAFVSGLLEMLWGAGYRAVAACDFEDALPHAGGYRWEGNRG
jgi:hypothetical protein